MLHSRWQLPVKENIPADTTHWPNVGSLLGQRRRRWANNYPTLGQCLVFSGIPNYQPQRSSLHTWDVNPMPVYWWAAVCDVGPTLNPHKVQYFTVVPPPPTWVSRRWQLLVRGNSIPANSRHSPNDVSMLGQHRRRVEDGGPALKQTSPT